MKNTKLVNMRIVAGYHCIGKPGRGSDDKFRILGSNLVEPDMRAAAFSSEGKGVLCGVFDGLGGTLKGGHAAQHV